MITLSGDAQTSEYKAGEILRDKIIEQWPHIVTAPDKTVDILANVTCHGQSPRDIDLLLIADLGDGEDFNPIGPQRSSKDGKSDFATLHSRVRVRQICVAIELKETDPRSIRFEGTRAEVYYSGEGKWHDATAQAEKQPYSIKNYLQSRHLNPPYIASILWLKNCPKRDLPPAPHNILGDKWNWSGFLSALGTIIEAKWFQGGWNQSPFGLHSASPSQVLDAFKRKIEPSRLDRVRLEKLTQKSSVALKNLPVSEKLVIMRGKGGAGKTAHLLHLAHTLYQNEDARVLLLTYNRALVADVRRFLTLSGIRDASDGHAIAIRTIHEFFYEILATPALSLDISPETFLSSYNSLKEELSGLLREGYATPDYFEAVSNWDYVMVDEAQDLPPLERDLLLALFGPQRVIVADGIDQMVRSQKKTTWGEGLSKSQVHRENLGPCLRLKTNLVSFINAFTEAMELNVEPVVPHLENGGGHIIIRRTKAQQSWSDKTFWEQTLEANRKDGNAPVDVLICVPPSQVESPEDESRFWRGRDTLENAGLKVWDGTTLGVRESYPDLDEVRVVQYDSSRGLEGWVVVNLGLDDLYHYKFQVFANQLRAEHAAGQWQGPLDVELEAHRQAARFCLIPLSRAIDTLVLEISTESNRFNDALLEAARRCGDDYLQIENVP